MTQPAEARPHNLSQSSPSSTQRVTGQCDGAKAVTIAYSGILPDLFREGQGIVALGHINADGVLEADEVLAKHDEEYMPPEVAKAMNDAMANKAAQQPQAE